MIRAVSYASKVGANRTTLTIEVVTSVNDDMVDIAPDVFKAELVSIFKQLNTIDPEILLDALEIYKEGLE